MGTCIQIQIAGVKYEWKVMWTCFVTQYITLFSCETFRNLPNIIWHKKQTLQMSSYNGLKFRVYVYVNFKAIQGAGRAFR